MKLAYTMAPGRGDTDLVLERLAADLAARGLRCCGTVQINSERGKGTRVEITLPTELDALDSCCNAANPGE